jgi:hypothetical protein
MWSPAYLHRVFALPNAAASGFLASVLLFTTPVGLLGGWLAGRWLAPHRWGLTSALAVTALLTAAAFTIAFSTRDLATAKLFIILAICAFGSTAGSLTTLLVELVPGHLRTAAGSFGAVISTGVSGAPPGCWAPCPTASDWTGRSSSAPPPLRWPASSGRPR